MKEPTFDITSYDINGIYHKLYEANGEKEVLLNADEADELLAYLEYVSWIMNNRK